MSNDSIIGSVLTVVMGGFISIILLRYIGGTADVLLRELQGAGMHDYGAYSSPDMEGLLYLACWMPLIVSVIYGILNTRRKHQQTPQTGYYENDYY